MDLLEKCRKDDLLVIAEHFQISVSRQSLKRTIKTVVLDGLLELNVLSLPESVRETDQISEGMTTRERADADVGEVRLVEAEVKTGLPPFEPFSPFTPGSRENAQVKFVLLDSVWRRKTKHKPDALILICSLKSGGWRFRLIKR